MSVVWYTHLEQGRDVHPSREVLHALAHVLRLDVGERAYFFQLAYGSRTSMDRRGPIPALLSAAPAGTPPSLHRLLDVLRPPPAIVLDRCWDLVDCNAAFAAVLPDFGAESPNSNAPPLNVVEYVLTDPA